MEDRITDGMKKEAKIARNITIFCCVLVALTFVYMYVNGKSIHDKEVATMFFVYFMFGTVALYGWIYARTYRVEFDGQTIACKTVFRKMQVHIGDIEKYTCKQYRKSVFYLFIFYTKDKRYQIYTRHKDALEAILTEAGAKLRLPNE